MTSHFEKWEGLGNDFILIDAPVTAEVAARLCDRRRGIGADGVLSVLDAQTERPRMIVHNADGSRPEMCGNGLRCVAGWLAARGHAGPEVRVTTDAGERRCVIAPAGVEVFDVAVDMGIARLLPDLEVAFEGRQHRFRVIDVGNPHAITFDAYSEADVDRVGPVASVAPPGGTNVEFCRSETASAGNSPAIGVVVWERGVGRTLACGTGACAVAAVACDEGRARFGEPVIVRLPGGPLEVTVAPGTLELTMRGPARRVFVGEARTS